MKKLISFLITGAMLLSAFPAVSAAEQPRPGYTTEQPAVKTDNDSSTNLDAGQKSALKGYAISDAAEFADKTGSASVGAGVSYSVKGDTLTISGSGSMQGLLDNQAFPWSNNASSIKHVVIQNGVTDIYSFAFMNFRAMESISVPSSVISGKHFRSIVRDEHW